MNTLINKNKKFISLFLFCVIWLEAVTMYIPRTRFLSLQSYDGSVRDMDHNGFKNRRNELKNIFYPTDQKILSSIKNADSETPLLKLEQGGPSTPEVQGFAGASSDQMVNLSTGDFNYNIPLMDVGGFPINIAFNSSITPNEEASWVGLGWSLNPGSVNRNVRGLPDDFNGAEIIKDANMKPKEGFSVGANLSFGYAGFDGALGGSLGVGLDMDHNNYEGWGVKLGGSVGLSANANFGNSKMGGSLGLGLGVHSKSGGYLAPSLGLSGTFGGNSTSTQIGLNGNLSIDSREGFKEVTFGASASMSLKHADDERREENKPEVENMRNIGYTDLSFPLGYASPSYSPTFEIPIHHFSQGYRLKGGGTVNGVTVEGDLVGTLFKQTIQQRTTKKAFGYMYSQNASNEDLLDFNRENEGIYYDELPNLPITAATFDIYQVNGHIGGGSYRPYRMDVGTIHDPYLRSTSSSFNVGLDIDGGNIVHVGLDVKGDNGSSENRIWTSGNPSSEQLIFRDTTLDPLYVPVYFKNPGELTAMEDTTLYNHFGQNIPSRFHLHQPDGTATADATNKIITIPGQPANTLVHTYRSKREYQNTQFQYRSYHDLLLSNETYHEFLRYERPPNVDKQIAEIRIIDPSGTKSVFGLPALNVKTKEFSFDVQHHDRVENHPQKSSTGLVDYEESDATINNKKGEGNYFNATTTPAYAYAWHITSLLSDDFVDVTLNGPTPDDLGTYTKFEYSRIHDNFKWRMPLDSATFQELRYHTSTDNKASFTYGEKEIYHVKQVNTRNYIALFHTSQRNDGHGVTGESGGIDFSKKLHKLDSIQLFTTAEYEKSNKVPIKTVHFEYDYTLNQKQPNSLPYGSDRQTGKLTLKKIYFTYELSKKHKESPYVFEYNTINPDYHLKTIDRWGYYKPNNPTQPNDQYPYTFQHKDVQNVNARAWLLTDIHLPIGGKMSIEYESDDYGYVQDRRAMTMMAIKGVSNTSSFVPEVKNLLRKNYNGAYIFFEIPFGISRSQAAIYEFVNGIKELYFKVNLNVSPDKFEQISGFIPCQYDWEDWNVEFGLDNVNLHLNHFWIKVPLVLIGQDPEINNIPEHSYTTELIDGRSYRHPFRQAAFQTISTTLPRLIDPRPIESAMSETSVSISALGRAFDELGRRFDEIGAGGVFNYLDNTNRCTIIDLNNAYVRLNEPNFSKMGGGVRVKRIEIHDNWRKMQTIPSSPEIDFKYGVIYHYTKSDGKSSGVASYEPSIGKDENPFYMPIPIEIQRKLGIDITNYQFEPIGELFYPSPQVVYSRVTQQNIAHPGVKKHAMGYTISEYYTAKDFPTISLRTDKQAIPKSLTIPLQVYNRSENTVAVSQGFCVELNDMHGKSKSVKEYDEYHNLITSTDYMYKTDVLGRLDNYVKCINQTDGTNSQRQVGVSYDVIVDANSYFTEILGGGVELNVNVSMYGTFPLVLVIPVPVVNNQVSEYRGITITKVITRNGILERIVTNKLGAINQSNNIAFDPKTGNPIVTMIDNEFDQFYYTVNIPAYWAYPEMGHSSQNFYAYIHQAVIRDGVFTHPNAARIFTPGDLVYLQHTIFSRSRKLWVFKVAGNEVYFIQHNGSAFTDSGNYNIRIIQSGYKNKLKQSIYSFTSVSNPILSSLNLHPSNLIQAQANTYSDYWQTNFSHSARIEDPTCNCSIVKSQERQTFRIDDINLNRTQIIDASGCAITVSSLDGQPIGINPLTLNLELPPGIESRCESTDYVLGTLRTNSGVRIFVVQSDCKVLVTCSSRPGARTVSCTEDNVQNPYLTGILGNYMSLATHTPHVKVSHSDRLTESGYLLGLSPFWSFRDGLVVKNVTSDGWQRGDSLISVNQLSKGLESWNALDIPVSSVFDYGDAIPTAVAANAFYNDILYDGFEGIQYYISRIRPTGINCEYKNHGKFSAGASVSGEDINNMYDNTISHSGVSSVKLNSGLTAQLFYPVGIRTSLRGSKSSRKEGRFFTSNRSDLITGFSPRGGVKYLFSTWVYKNQPEVSTYTGCQVTVNGINFLPSGPIIDGWQQINGEFTPLEGTNLLIVLGASSQAWFDDFRIQPYNAQMETYTYDSANLRYLAKHNDQNYSSYFEYDSEGKLVRSKQETEVGIFTIMESRAELPKFKR